MRNTFAHNLDRQFDRIFSVPPNDLGNKQLTFFYKLFTRPLKQMPFLYIIPFSFLTAVFLYYLLGPLLIKLVSILQYGF
jgi:hypothetical protein